MQGAGVLFADMYNIAAWQLYAEVPLCCVLCCSQSCLQSLYANQAPTVF